MTQAFSLSWASGFTPRISGKGEEVATSNYDGTRCPRRQQVDTGRKTRSCRQPPQKPEAGVSSKRGPGGPPHPSITASLVSFQQPTLACLYLKTVAPTDTETLSPHPISDPSSHSNIPSSTSRLGTPIALSGQWVYLFAKLLIAHLLHPVMDGTASPTNIHSSPTAGTSDWDLLWN